jgi:hypothetical protein
VNHHWYRIEDLPAGRVRVRVRWPGYVVDAVGDVDKKGRRHWHEIRGRELKPLRARVEAWQPCDATQWRWQNGIEPEPIRVEVRPRIGSIGGMSFDAANAAAEMEEWREAARADYSRDDGAWDDAWDDMTPSAHTGHGVPTVGHGVPTVGHGVPTVGHGVPTVGHGVPTHKHGVGHGVPTHGTGGARGAIVQWWRDVTRVVYEPMGAVSREHGEARIMRHLILERSLPTDIRRQRSNAAVLADLKLTWVDVYGEQSRGDDWVPPLVPTPHDWADFDVVMGWFSEVAPRDREMVVLRARMLSPPRTWLAIGNEINRSWQRAQQIYRETICSLVAAGNRPRLRAEERIVEVRNRNKLAKLRGV